MARVGRRSPAGAGTAGQTLVEFALILPVFILVLFGIVDFGRAIYAYNAISNAAREGGRTAIVNQNVGDIQARAIDQATGLSIPATPPAGCSAAGVPVASSGICVKFLLPDLSTDCSTTLAPGCAAVVTVKYSFNAITPVISVIVGTPAMTSITKQTIESVCTGSGCPIP